MKWDLVVKGVLKTAELGAEYLKHSRLIDQLIQLPPDAARQELERVWAGLDTRARTGLRMALGALIFKHQTATTDTSGRLERLVALRDIVSPDAAQSVLAPERASQVVSSAVTGARARVAALVERAVSLRRGELAAMLEREVEIHRPDLESKSGATWNAVSTQLKALAARAEAMGQSPEGKAALTAFRDTLVAALTEKGEGGERIQPDVSARPAPPQAAKPAEKTSGRSPGQSLSGLWSGVLRSGDETMNTSIRVSPAGRTMYGYRDMQGYQEVELYRVGQQIQYVPQGGGVVTVKVLDLSNTPQGCAHLISWSFERAANGYMDQQYERIAVQCELKGDRLAMTYVETGDTFMSDLGMMLGSGTQVRQFTGLLDKEQSESWGNDARYAPESRGRGGVP